MTLQIKVDLSGIPAHQRSIERQLDRSLAKIAEGIVTDTKLSFGRSRGGRTYRRGRGRTHTASVAGSPPAVDTGTLRASMRQERSGKLERTVYTGVEYAEYLELGTPKVAARPFLGPQFAAAARTMERDLKKGLKF